MRLPLGYRALEASKLGQIPYSHLSNKRGAWNKRGGVQKLQNQ